MIDADLSDRFRLFSGRASRELAWEVADLLGRDLCEVRFQTFHEGEFHIQIEQSVRGVDAYVIQPTCQPVNDNLMELLVLIDALRRASAATITAVVPYFGYARQDHKSTGREPITAKLVANLLTTAGADRVVSIDLHSPQLQGFFDIPVDHLTAVTTLSRYLRDSFDLSNAVVVAADVGRAKIGRQVRHDPGAADGGGAQAALGGGWAGGRGGGYRRRRRGQDAGADRRCGSPAARSTSRPTPWWRQVRSPSSSASVTGCWWERP